MFNDFPLIEGASEDLVQVPGFLGGSLADRYMPRYEREMNGNSKFYFGEKDNSGFVRGVSSFGVGLLNRVFSLDEKGNFIDPKFRTIVPTDNIYEIVYPMVRDGLYTHLNALDVWEKSKNDKNIFGYMSNAGIWNQAVELAEQNQGRVKFPFRIQGFYFVPGENEGIYREKIVPAKNFRLIQDDRLSLPTGTKFDSLDEEGIIEPKDDGRFNKHTKGYSVSANFFCDNGDWISYCDNLSLSFFMPHMGRVVVVNA
jgi:uncharacterized membrane protein YiaA